MTYFKKQEKADAPGEFEFIEVPDTELEVPDEVIVKSKAYNTLKASDIKRHNQIKELKAKLDTADAVADDAEKPETAPIEQNAPGQVAEVKPLDEEELFAKFTARLEAQAAAKRDAEAKEQARYTDLITKHKLNSDALELLQEAKNPEVLAEKLAKSRYHFDEQEGGSPATADKEQVLNNVLENLGIGDK